MKARTIQFIGMIVVLSVPLIAILVIAKGHYSPDQIGGLAAISFPVMALGLGICVCSKKLGSS